MQNTTIVKKNCRNLWEARTTVKLADIPGDEPGERVLELLTMKRFSGKVTSTASASIARKRNGYTVNETIPFEDYNRTVKIHEVARVTEKTIMRAHNEALSYFDACIEDAKKRYNIA